MPVPVARWSTPFQITNFGLGGRPVVSAVGGGDAGEFVIVWDQFGDPLGLGDPSGYGVYAQVYNQDGSRQGSTFLVNSSTTSEQVEPVVVSRNTADGFAVAWRDSSRAGTGFGTDARLRLFDGNGGAASGEFLATNGGPTESGTQSQVSVARGEAFGAVFVTWTDFASAPHGDGMDIRGALFGNSGALGPDFRITTAAAPSGETGFQAQSNVASLPRTGFVVTWTDNVNAGDENAGGGTAIRGQLFNFLGASIGSNFTIASVAGPASSQIVQRPVSAGLNLTTAEFVTAWVQDDDVTAGVDLNVYARIYGISGGAPVGGTAFLLSSGTARNQNQVVLASYQTDRFIAVWTDGVAFGPPEVRARMFDASGVALTDEFVVIPEDTLVASHAGQLASVTVLDDTINAHPIPRFVVTWNDNTGNMWGQIFSPAASSLLGIDWFGSDRPETYTAQYGERVLAGNGGSDNLTGSAGDDDMRGGVDHDMLRGVDGNDRLAGDTGIDILNGGNGIDTADYSADIAGVAAYLYDVRAFGGIVGNAAFASGTGVDTDYLISIESLTGGSGADYLYGDFQANTLSGNGSNDYLRGLQGDDVINGGDGIDLLIGDEGNDTLNGGNDRDIMDGGADNDTLNGDGGNDEIYTGTGTDTVNGGAGSDIVYIVDTLDSINGGTETDYLVWNLTSAVNLTITNAMSIEWAQGRDAADTMNAAGISSFIELQGNGGDDTLIAGNGGSILLGGAGLDTLTGGNNTDHMVGSTEADKFRTDAGGGTDYVYDFVKSTDKLDLTLLADNGIHGTGDLTLNSTYGAVSGWWGYSYGTGTIWVNTGVGNGALAAGDFLFA